MYSENKGKVVLDCLATLDYRKLNSCADIICEGKRKRITVWLELQVGSSRVWNMSSGKSYIRCKMMCSQDFFSAFSLLLCEGSENLIFPSARSDSGSVRLGISLISIGSSGLEFWFLHRLLILIHQKWIDVSNALGSQCWVKTHQRFYPPSFEIVLDELEVWTDIKLWQSNLDQLHVLFCILVSQLARSTHKTHATTSINLLLEDNDVHFPMHTSSLCAWVKLLISGLLHQVLFILEDEASKPGFFFELGIQGFQFDVWISFSSHAHLVQHQGQLPVVPFLNESSMQMPQFV